MKRLIMIGGPMGVGKSAVCACLKKKLSNNVFLDGDWCWDMTPFSVTEETKKLVLENITFLLSNFLKCSLYENIIFCWVMDRREIIDDVLSRLDTRDVKVLTFSLLADERTLRERILKDVKNGLRLPDAAERSLAYLPRYEKLDTCKIDTTGKTPEETALLIAGLLGEKPDSAGRQRMAPQAGIHM